MHAGTKLTPPVGDGKRVRELGPLMPTEISVSGTSFRESGTDVAIAGLGWLGVAVDGTAQLRWEQDPELWGFRVLLHVCFWRLTLYAGAVHVLIAEGAPASCS